MWITDGRKTKTNESDKIKQLIRLHQSGSGIKTIARILGMSKNTVRSYLKKIAEDGFNALPTSEQLMVNVENKPTERQN